MTTLKIELLETSKEQLSINLIDCKNKLMGAEDSDASSPGRQPKYVTQEDPDAFQDEKVPTLAVRGVNQMLEHREGLQRKLQKEHREGLPRKLQQEHRERLPRKLQQENRDGLRKLKQEHREGLPRKLQQEHREGLQRNLAQEDRDGWPRKLAHEDRDGWPRKLYKKIVMDCREQSQNSTPGARGVNPSTGHTNIVMDCSEN